MALDTFSRVMGIECCWIQTVGARERNKLELSAERGFSLEIRREMAAVDMGHVFSRQIIGLGQKIIIPDLSKDGRYGLPSFRDTGYKWLVAVPLMTYRVHGILGSASRHRKRLQKDTADIIMVIAGLIAASLGKASLSRRLPGTGEPVRVPARNVKENPVMPEQKLQAAGSPSHRRRDRHSDGAFQSHARRMENFRRSHR